MTEEQHRNINERGRWKTARDRDRNKARFLIRERILAAAASSTDNEIPEDTYREVSSTTTTNACISITTDTESTSHDLVQPVHECNKDNVPFSSIHEHILPQQDTETILRYYLHAIAIGSTSTFSHKALSTPEHFEILSCPIHPVAYWSTYKIQTLCTSRFGPKRAAAMLTYQQNQSSASLMEYAALLGHYDLVGMLLFRGISPLLWRKEIEESSMDTVEEKKDGFLPDPLVSLSIRKRKLSTVITRRFLIEPMPITLATYIFKSICEMRMWSIVRSVNMTIDVTGGYVCSICNCPTELKCSTLDRDYLQSYIPPMLYYCNADGASDCNHSFCALCMWESLMQKIDDRFFETVMFCPLCEPIEGSKVSISSDNIHHHMQEMSLSANIRRERYLSALEKFNALPASVDNLKALPSKGKTKSKNAVHSTWYQAIAPTLGTSKDVRQDKFIKYVNRCGFNHVYSCLLEGIDVNAINEYNQTALYIASWKNCPKIVKLLLDFGADVDISAHGPMSVWNVASENGYKEIMALLQPFQKEARDHAPSKLRDKLGLDSIIHLSSVPLLSILIDHNEEHPGAGACFIDDFIQSNLVSDLISLWREIPVHQSEESMLKNKNKATPCSSRSYFCDAEGHFVKYLSRQLQDTLDKGFDDKKCHDSCVAQFFPQMRFLNYYLEGSALPPHVDLNRIDSKTGQRSTHTFLLYLSDCNDGGETVLLRDLVPNTDKAYVQIAKVQPRKGRLLLFPHNCPHEGRPTQALTSKLLLRGEVMINSNPLVLG